MASGVAYSLGKFVGRNRLLVAVMVAVTLIYWNFSDSPPEAPPGAPVAAVKSATPAPRKPDPMIATCTTGIDAVMTRAKEAMRKKDVDAAYAVLHACRQHMTDPKALALYKTATVESAKKATQAAAKAERAIKAAKKREGVRIGMSQQDAIDSSWGKPERINRTTNTWGTREQWVYDGGYLYFDNGVLTSIQN